MTTATAKRKHASSAIKTKRHKPLTNITQDGNGYTLYIAVPGIAKKDLEISVEKSDLVVSGTSETETYRRVFQIPSHIDSGQITATLKQGILQVSLFIQESMKKKEIQII